MKPELLAPAGNLDIGKAAFAAGADAIYIGAESFSARAHAKNFSLHDIQEILRYASDYGKKVYLAMNTLVHNSEVGACIALLESLGPLLPHAIITQDLGLAYLIKNIWPTMPLHASTQMVIHNIEGLKTAKQLGFERAVLARECTLEAIQHMAQQDILELEVFVHGALCISYSGNCYMSGEIGGRSGNRGACAQPCRQPYTLKAGDNKNLGTKHWLSAKDIQSLDLIPQFIQAGVHSFKIEGRMKKLEYVVQTTKSYREAIDAVYNNVRYCSTDALDAIAQIFNRGEYSHGHLLGERGHALMIYTSPKNEGLHLGEIKKKQSDAIVVHLERPLQVGDGIAMYGKEHRFLEGGYVADMKDATLKQNIHEAAKNMDIILPCEFAKEVEEIRKTSDVALEKKIRRFAKRKPPKQEEKHINFYLEAFIGQPLKLTALTDSGESYIVEHTYIVEEASKRGTSHETIREKLSRLGNTHYLLAHLEINADENAFIPASALNQLRQEVCKMLEDKTEDSSFAPFSAERAYAFLDAIPPAVYGTSEKKVWVMVREAWQYDIAFKNGADAVVYILSNPSQLEDVARRERVILALPEIIEEEDLKAWQFALEGLPEGHYVWYIQNLSHISLLEKTKISSTYYGGWLLNITNDLSVASILHEKIEGFTLSIEMTFSDAIQLSSLGNIKSIYYAHGYLPAMRLAHAPQCQNLQTFTLENRHKDQFLWEKHSEKYSVIYAAQPRIAYKDIKALVDQGIDIILLDLTLENKEENLSRIVTAYKKAVQNGDYLANFDHWCKTYYRSKKKV